MALNFRSCIALPNLWPETPHHDLIASHDRSSQNVGNFGLSDFLKLSKVTKSNIKGTSTKVEKVLLTKKEMQIFDKI